MRFGRNTRVSVFKPLRAPFQNHRYQSFSRRNSSGLPNYRSHYGRYYEGESRRRHQNRNHERRITRSHRFIQKPNKLDQEFLQERMIKKMNRDIANYWMESQQETHKKKGEEELKKDMERSSKELNNKLNMQMDNYWKQREVKKEKLEEGEKGEEKA